MSVKSLDTVIDLDKNGKNNQNVAPTMRMNRLRVKSGSNDRLFKTLSKCEDYNGVITIYELEKDIRDSSKSTKVRRLLADVGRSFENVNQVLIIYFSIKDAREVREITTRIIRIMLNFI